MTLEERMRLSFYQPLEKIAGYDYVTLVRHTETGDLFVKKELKDYNLAVYYCLRKLDSKYFPRIVELVENEGKLILVEEYVSGQTLEEYVQTLGTLSLSAVCRIMLQLIDAVELLHTHEPPIIHRDIKPSNIVHAPDGIWKLIDFNTARMYDEGARRDTTFLGTKSFAAPEQFGDLQTDARTDIYALGAMMNYLLTGMSHKKLLADGAAGRIIEKCTRFSPDERYQDTGQLRKDIEKLLPKTAAPMYESEGVESDRKKQKFPFAPPGFRSFTIWKMIVASAGYALLFYTAAGLQIIPRNGEVITPHILLVDRTGFFILGLVLILFWFNYGGIHTKLPLVRRNSLKWKALGYLLYTVLITFVIMILIVIAEDAIV